MIITVVNEYNLFIVVDGNVVYFQVSYYIFFFSSFLRELLGNYSNGLFQKKYLTTLAINSRFYLAEHML